MSFCKFIAATLGATSVASAFSLYETAPVVGVAESQAASYFAACRFGYDTNPQGSTNRKNKDDDAGCFVNASLSTSYADVESVDKVRYSARLGGTHYLGTASGNGRKYYGDCTVDTSMVHAFSMRSRYTAGLHVSYMPEPGYDNGFSSAGMRGDTLSWSLNNGYSEAVDARWSWNIGANLSGTHYEEHTQRIDDRQYYSCNVGLNYRESDRLTYTSSVSMRMEPRSYGADSKSGFASVGVQYALSPVSSASLNVGAQGKAMSGRTTVNPTLDVGYRRRVADGLSVNGYIKYSDENVDNYRRDNNASYRSGGTWRVGAYGTYVLSPDVSYVFQVQFQHTEYTKGTTPGMADAKRTTVRPSVTMNYSFTPSLQGNLSAEYTYYRYDREKASSKYTRWQYSAGLTYRF